MGAVVLGLDIGGANLKAAHVDGRALSVPFALWKEPALLSHALRRLLHEMPAADVLAVTTTGELCDCYESKRQGVLAILDAVTEAAGTTPVRVWRNDGRFVDLSAARQAPLLVAAANWLALATFTGPYATWGTGLLLDVGSTTTDVIPLLDGRPVAKGTTDPERLRCHELVYTGVRRTPLCALLGEQTAAEFFATTLDAYLVLECLPEWPSDRNTADGRPAMKAFAHARLARMLCADLDTSSKAERLALAEQTLSRQMQLIQQAVTEVAARLPHPPLTLLFAGEGEFLAERAVRALPDLAACRKVHLSAKLGGALSQAACAYAVAMLAAKE